MASVLAPKIQTFVASGDMSSSQYCFVKFVTDQETVELAGDGEKFNGVVQNAPEDGEYAEVAVAGGGALVKLSGAVTRGQSLCAAANGKGDAGTSGDWACTPAESGVSGDVIAAYLDMFYKA
jgi:hypothetical protein